MNLALFDFAVSHVLRIGRIMKMARGNALLVGLGGSGRQTLTKLASLVCDYDIFTVQISKQYNLDQWQEDMKILMLKAGA